MIEPPPDGTTSPAAAPKVTDILIVGEPADVRTQAIAGAFQGRPDYSVGRVDDIPESMATIGGSDDLVVFVFLDSREEASRLMKVHVLVEQGARVIILVANESRELRAMAFAAGATDVIYPPWEPLRIESCVATILHRSVRKGVRCAAEVPVIVAPPVGADVHGILCNVSRDGFLADLPILPSRPGGIVRVGIQPPGREPLPFLFARVVGIDRAGGTGSGAVRGQFVGLTPADRQAVDAFVSSVVAVTGSAITDQIEALLALDAMRLREQLEVDIAGVRAPALTGYERAGLFSDDGGTPAKFAVVALARARTTMLGFVLGRSKDGEAARLLEPHRERLLAEIQQARDVLRDELAARMGKKAEAGVREIRNLQAKLEAAADVLSRALGEASRSKTVGLQEVSAQPATFEKSAAPPPTPVAAAAKPSADAATPTRGSRLRAGILTAVLAVVIAGGAWIAAGSGSGNRDLSRTVVEDAPQLVAGPLHVRATFRDSRGMVAVVDSTWYSTDRAGRSAGVAEIARQVRLGAGQRLAVKDYAGRIVAIYPTSGGAAFRR